ncbi:MAG: four helix bundle protein [Candidatus Omnitrophica bacterium]|nr:four helix bundle protein [Candidatus Omnitrophota bacterium]
MSIRKFEELDIWKRTRELTKIIYKISSVPGFSRDWGLRDQLRRASVSVMSNIAEGFDSGSRKEFARFLSISRRSTSEMQSQLYVALDQSYMSQEDFKLIYKEIEEIRRMITSFIKYLKGIKKTNSLNSPTRKLIN